MSNLSQPEPGKSSQGKPKLRQRRAGPIVLGVLLVTALLAGARWYFAPKEGWPEEVILRTRAVGEKVLPSSVPTAEWKLKLPGAFEIGTVGKNGGIYGGVPDDQKSFFSVSMVGVTNADNLNFTPRLNSDLAYEIAHFMAIHLYNYRGRISHVGKDACVSQDDFSAALLAAGDTLGGTPGCDASLGRCNIYTHLDGWDVQLAVSRPLYNDPRRACDIAKAFLNEHAIHRDNIQ